MIRMESQIPDYAGILPGPDVSVHHILQQSYNDINNKIGKEYFLGL
jgi:hypothetical protein